jgi:HTH-type transcriptional regulator/antitoxin HigA
MKLKNDIDDLLGPRDACHLREKAPIRTPKGPKDMAKTRNPEGVRDQRASDRYLELVRRFPLRPIRSESELDAAIAVIDSLIDTGELSDDETDYLDVLGDLVKKYETEHHPLPPVSGGDMLRHLIEARGTTQARVAAGTGIAGSTVSEILAGKRGLSRRHIEALARHFHVSPAVFMSV